MNIDELYDWFSHNEGNNESVDILQNIEGRLILEAIQDHLRTTSENYEEAREYFLQQREYRKSVFAVSLRG